MFGSYGMDGTSDCEWLAARVRTGRRLALDRLGKLGCRERDPVQDVTLADLERVDPEVREELPDDRDAADDHRRAIRLEPRQLAALVDRRRGEPRQLELD